MRYLWRVLYICMCLDNPGVNRVPMGRKINGVSWPHNVSLNLSYTNVCLGYVYSVIHSFVLSFIHNVGGFSMYVTSRHWDNNTSADRSIDVSNNDFIRWVVDTHACIVMKHWFIIWVSTLACKNKSSKCIIARGSQRNKACYDQGLISLIMLRIAHAMVNTYMYMRFWMCAW